MHSTTTASDVVRVMSRLRQTHELGMQSFSVLCVFWDQKLYTVFDVADTLHIPRATARTHIQDLFNLELLDRVSRGVYSLSVKGHKLIEKNFPETYETDASA